ncbi:MAG: eCIS core domain-containing protein [Thermomicrobiales bacterium]
MFERQLRPMRRPDPTPFSAAPTPFAPDATTAPPTKAATPQQSGVGFDIGRIAIFPPEPQIGPGGGAVAPDLTDHIQRSKRAGGAPLEPVIERKMEASFGHNFADVRIHADGETDVLNRSLSANAFTLGSDIFLSQEAASAGPYGGDRLLAHELTHVVQQRGAEQGGSLTVSGVNDPEEHDATTVAAQVVAGYGEIEPAHPMSAARVGVAPVRVQRDVDSSSGGQDDPTGAKGRLAPNPIAVLQKHQAATDLDLQWRAIFGERMESYSQALMRISGGIDQARKDFEDTHAAQARTDQLFIQILGGIGAFVFAAGFQWAFTAVMDGLGFQASKINKVIEAVENPANTFVSGGVNAIAAAHANTSADQGEVPSVNKNPSPEVGSSQMPNTGDSQLAYLTTNGEVLSNHRQMIEQAFAARSGKTRNFTDRQWMAFDLAAQEDSYRNLLEGLTMAGAGVETLKPRQEIADVAEKYLWAYWIRSEFTRHIAEFKHREVHRRPGAEGPGDSSPEAQEAYDAADNLSLGSDVEQRLNKIGVSEMAGVTLSGHWYSGNSPNEWREMLLFWAFFYSDSLALQQVYVPSAPILPKGDLMA